MYQSCKLLCYCCLSVVNEIFLPSFAYVIFSLSASFAFNGLGKSYAPKQKKYVVFRFTTSILLYSKSYRQVDRQAFRIFYIITGLAVLRLRPLGRQLHFQKHNPLSKKFQNSHFPNLTKSVPTTYTQTHQYTYNIILTRILDSFGKSLLTITALNEGHNLAIRFLRRNTRITSLSLIHQTNQDYICSTPYHCSVFVSHQYSRCSQDLLSDNLINDCDWVSWFPVAVCIFYCEMTVISRVTFYLVACCICQL